METGTEVPVHRHPTKDESFVILRGKVRSTTYNDDGSIIDSVVLSQEDGVYGVDIPKGVWHKLESLETNSVIFECKGGRLCHTRRMAYLMWWNLGTNEPLCYGNGQEYNEGDLGFL